MYFWPIMEIIVFNLAIIVLLEYSVLLVFFSKEWLPGIQFSALANAVTFFIGLYLFTKLGMHWAVILAVVTLIEALAIFFFWTVKPTKALVVSLSANLVSRGFFQLVYWLGLNIYPF